MKAGTDFLGNRNPFADYGKKAYSLVNQPQKLIGVIKTRADARTRYSEIVDELNACEDADTLGAFLVSINKELVQFRAELDFYWDGDGDFAGLREEITRAKARVDGDTGAYTGSWS